MMQEFDDGLPQRHFDNFQFVPYEEIRASCLPEEFEARLAVACLMEIPAQFQALRSLGLLLEPTHSCAPRATRVNSTANELHELPSAPHGKGSTNQAHQRGHQRVLQAAESMASAQDTSPPENFVCPITHELMTDPVVCADGYTYEKDAIENWFAQKEVSPMTNEQVETRLIPNHSLRSQIMEWRQTH
eukprot:TRINITY_DN21783_c0_g1_i2.p1 TRINITY_DN21783_c0_g1~~TRINITY_DN21783_c0_g1_i2.p1  ORF type:complete len:188 (-),score=29.53 TRINITY_DN21783_c0_g1_i2:128-691(-)